MPELLFYQRKCFFIDVVQKAVPDSDARGDGFLLFSCTHYRKRLFLLFLFPELFQNAEIFEGCDVPFDFLG